MAARSLREWPFEAPRELFGIREEQINPEPAQAVMLKAAKVRARCVRSSLHDNIIKVTGAVRVLG